MSSKDFDLIVFGATSFTGKLVVEYLDNNYKDNISWALAGISKEKLEAVKEQLSCDVPILIIDSEPQNDIQNALSKTKLVKGTSAVGINQCFVLVLNKSSENFGNCPVP